jgi:hypothetical protein
MIPIKKKKKIFSKSRILLDLKKKVMKRKQLHLMLFSLKIKI